MTSSITDDLKSFRRSWVQHTGMQLATLTVLAATFSVVAFVFSLSLNFKRILSSWGDGVQVTVYLQDEVTDADARKLMSEMRELKEIADATYVGREVATDNFKRQMASYAPDLLADADFSNPFPSSIRLSLKGGASSEDDVSKLEALAGVIQKMPGVEDVSYGQSWVKNYSSFVSTLNASGGFMAFVLLTGGLFVVGNSVRASISARREEIEILELVGATAAMIRRPYVFEGMLMGALAAIFALVFNLGAVIWQKKMMATSLVLSRLVPMVSSLDVLSTLAFLGVCASLGAFGAWITVRKINDGWSARGGIQT